MSDDKIQTVKIEIVSPDREPRPRPEALLRQIVQSEVAKLMATREEWLLQPFLQQARISDEIRRLQNVPEQKKWTIFFAKWGCLVCGGREPGHVGCGLCGTCYSRTAARLAKIVRGYKPRSEDPEFGWREDEQIARSALPAIQNQGGDRK